LLGDQSTPVLEYSEIVAGWSDYLSALHEEAAGDSHPTPVFSGNHAVAQVKKCFPSTLTVIREIGCSSGFLIKDLAAPFPEAAIIGADVVEEPVS
jgi:tRNA G46 methylase TrmB